MFDLALCRNMTSVAVTKELSVGTLSYETTVTNKLSVSTLSFETAKEGTPE